MNDTTQMKWKQQHNYSKLSKTNLNRINAEMLAVQHVFTRIKTRDNEQRENKKFETEHEYFEKKTKSNIHIAMKCL